MVEEGITLSVDRFQATSSDMPGLPDMAIDFQTSMRLDAPGDAASATLANSLTLDATGRFGTEGLADKEIALLRQNFPLPLEARGDALVVEASYRDGVITINDQQLESALPGPLGQQIRGYASMGELFFAQGLQSLLAGVEK